MDMPVATPGVLMRMWSGGSGDSGAEDEAGDALSSTDNLSVMVIDPTGAGGSDTDSKKEAEKAQKQAEQANPGMECKVYENKGTKITIVCWSEKDEVMVMAISSDLKTYSKKKKVNGKLRNVVFKQIPVIGQVQHIYTGKSTVTAADKDQAFREGKGLRDAQVAKLPATYS